MSAYRKIESSIWTGQTGRELLALGHLEALLAHYLITGPHSNMIGLYYLPIEYIAKDLRCSFEGASKALRRVCSTGFAVYDEASEHVWVVEVASFQVGRELKRGDKRSKGVSDLLATYRKVPMAQDFFAKYGETLNLKFEAPSKPLRSPFEAPSKPGTGTGTGTGSLSAPSLRSGDGEPDDSEAEPEAVAKRPAKTAEVDVGALHDELYLTYPASRRRGKSKALASLKRTVRTREDAARLRRVVAAHLAQASEERFVQHWFRLCADWREMPEVAPSRGAPAKTAQAPTTGSAAPSRLVCGDLGAPAPVPRREDFADEAAFRVAHAAWCAADDERLDRARREAGRIEREKFEAYRAEAARVEAERAKREEQDGLAQLAVANGGA